MAGLEQQPLCLRSSYGGWRVGWPPDQPANRVGRQRVGEARSRCTRHDAAGAARFRRHSGAKGGAAGEAISRGSGQSLGRADS